MFHPYGGSNETVSGWTPEPQGRGTFTILSTCLLTLGLCVWTAVHLNVPQYNHVRWQLIRKMGWLITGMFAPEMVAYTAYHQYSQARKLNAFVNDKLGHLYQKQHRHPALQEFRSWFWRRAPTGQGERSDVENNNSPLRPPWTATHGFYAVMGGFAIDTTDCKPPYMAANQERLTLTPVGLECLALLDETLMPNLSEEEIRDKSKANGLAKFIVCVQASWFCLQCVGRLSQGLPITLLELNTFVHALCTLITYWLWWDKPLDVQEPTLLQGQHKHEIAALLAVFQSRQAGYQINCAARECRHSPEARGLAYLYQLSGTGHTIGRVFEERYLQNLTPSSFPLSVYLTDQILSFAVSRKPVRIRVTKPCRCSKREYYINLTATDVRRILLASKGLDILDARKQASYSADDPLLSDKAWVDDCSRKLAAYPRSGDLICPRIRNWPDVSAFGYLEFFDERGWPKPVTVGFSLAGLAYGFLHLSAWAALFPTPAQTLLWRLSGLTLAASAPAIVAVTLALRLCQSTLWMLRKVRVLEKALFAAFLALPLSYALLYVFARVYLVAECFLTLSHLPARAFETPNWSLYLPHIS